jgi:hypothetical protein
MNANRNLLLATAALALSALSFQAMAEERICRGTIGPRALDNVRVPADASCILNGTRLNGNLLVERGASVQANNVRINGSVQAEGAYHVGVGPGSRIGGSVQIKQGGGASIINARIQGDLQFDENVLAIAATDNTIGGNLQAVKNFGGLLFYRNTIASGFECKENDPAPVGGGNTASSKVDQCSML